jgi:hypothetical protein
VASINREIQALLSQIEALQRTIEASSSIYANDPVALFQADGLTAYDWQREALTTDARRVILNITRQGGKSETGGAKGLHEALYTPNSEILFISPAGRQSANIYLRALSLFRAISAPMSTSKLSADEVRFSNGSRMVALPGNPDTIRGYSPNLVIIDEASRVSDELYHSIRPMLAATNGTLWSLSTPAGRRGWFFREFTNGPVRSKANPGGWLKFEVPADQVPHINRDDVEADRQSLGDLIVAQEYECQFIEGIGSFFRPEDIRRAFSGYDIPALFETDLPEWEDASIEVLA